MDTGLCLSSHPFLQFFLAVVAMELWTSPAIRSSAFFSTSPKVGLGLYNSISAIEATALEFGMFLLGAAVYATYVVRKRKAGAV